jgi:dienelactone hydrolase
MRPAGESLASTSHHRPPPRSGTARLAAQLRRQRLAKSSGARARELVFLALLILLLWIGWPFARAHLQSVAVLDLVANKPVPWLLHRLVTEPIQTQELQLSLPSGPVRARLYAPSSHPNAPALIVLHGVHYLGIDEPRLVTFSSAIASCGLRVLTPELPDIKDYHIGANSITTIGESAQWMARANGGHPVGVLGLSFSGGLALLAAANPEFRPSIKFVVAVGSQDEMARVAQYYRTGEDLQPNGTEEVLPPHEYGALVLEYEHLDEFVPARDLTAIRAVLRAHLYQDADAEKVALARLTLSQSNEATQLMNTASPATRAALARAGTRHIQDMAGVSPHGHLAHLTTPVYLLHGEGDNVIPSAETEWMEAELPSETLKAALISPVLSHLNLDGAGPTALDHVRLVHFFAMILHAAEAR